MKKFSDLSFAIAIVTLLSVACSDSVPTWKTFISPQGDFSIAFPGSHNETKKTMRTQAGNIDIKMLIHESGSITYMAAFSEYPSGLSESVTTDKILDGARDGGVANVRGKLLDEMQIDLNGHPGREIKVAAAGGAATIRARFYLVGNRLYQCQVITKNENAYSTSANRFLNSLKLL